MPALRALALNCTLKASPEGSSCELLLSELLARLGEHGVEGEIVRAVELNIKPGVSSDEGEGDDWPGLRERILEADIFVLGTPIWLGHPSSVCDRDGDARAQRGAPGEAAESAAVPGRLAPGRSASRRLRDFRRA
jgi:NADPH-dependent FMN reductase